MTSRAERLRETLAVLDVGHGNSAVLFSGDDVAVFDTGTGSGLLEFLRQQGVDHVKTVFSFACGSGSHRRPGWPAGRGNRHGRAGRSQYRQLEGVRDVG